MKPGDKVEFLRYWEGSGTITRIDPTYEYPIQAVNKDGETGRFSYAEVRVIEEVKERMENEGVEGLA